MHALLKVKEMESAFHPGSLCFAVSDIKRVPDPFLCVAGHGTDKYVIDVWDEPGW